MAPDRRTDGHGQTYITPPSTGDNCPKMGQFDGWTEGLTDRHGQTYIPPPLAGYNYCPKMEVWFTMQ